MKYLMLAIISMMMSYPSLAVDGYKDLKFGMEKEEFIKKKPCSLNLKKKVTGGEDRLECRDFKFGGKRADAWFYFIDGKFERMGIQVDSSRASSLLNSLRGKYGPPSSASTNQEMEATKTIPGASAFVAFDDDTIKMLLIRSPDDYSELVALIYTSKDYDEKVNKHQAKSIEDDI